MWTNHYLVEIQYLGYRYSGWAVQKDVKTVHQMIDKTVKFVLGHERFKTLGCSRTDAKVSANAMYFELFLKEGLNANDFLNELNFNLATDIRALNIKKVDKKFNIIQASKRKDYVYLFCYKEKPHPFCGALLTYYHGDLDFELMVKGATLFQGHHNFKHYCTKPGDNTKFNREILSCTLTPNDYISASFFPENTFALRISSKGFLRYQIRLIMAQLIRLGRHEITLEYIENTLINPPEYHMPNIAPPSGLVLDKIDFE